MTNSIINSKTLARIATIQAVYNYQMIEYQDSLDVICKRLVNYYTSSDIHQDNNIDTNYIIQLNDKYFINLCEHIKDKLKEIDTIISATLFDNDSLDHLPPLLLALLRSAASELKYIESTPYKIILSEFTNISSVFLSEKEVNFTNMAIDKIYKNISKQE